MQSPPTPAAEPTPEPAPAVTPAGDPDAGAVATAAPVIDVADAAAAAPSDAAVATAPTTAPTSTPTTPPRTPPATTTATTTVAQGRAVFQRICARCHEDNDPDGPHPNRRWPEARMRTLIRSGNSQMRAIPVARLSDADLAQLITYLRSTHAVQ